MNGRRATNYRNGFVSNSSASDFRDSIGGSKKTVIVFITIFPIVWAGGLITSDWRGEINHCDEQETSVVFLMPPTAEKRRIINLLIGRRSSRA